MFAALILAAALQAGAVEAAPAPVELAPGVHLISGAILPNRGPDGNTVIFDAREGLIVVDTGRHVWHSDAILSFARERQRPIAAIFNTHWHLDHSSGNGRIKTVFPNARVYATNAIDRALSPEGFLTINTNQARLAAMLADPAVPEIQKEEIRNGLATMAAPDALRPDVVIAGPQRYARRRAQARCAGDGRRGDGCGCLAVRPAHACGGAGRSGDVPLAVLRERLPERLARGAGRGVGDAVPDRGSGARRADGS